MLYDTILCRVLLYYLILSYICLYSLLSNCFDIIYSILYFYNTLFYVFPFFAIPFNFTFPSNIFSHALNRIIFQFNLISIFIAVLFKLIAQNRLNSFRESQCLSKVIGAPRLNVPNPQNIVVNSPIQFCSTYISCLHSKTCGILFGNDLS